MESIHNKITKILISIQVYHNCRKSALKSSLGLHLQMKRQLNSNRNIKEEGTWRKPELELEGLLVKGSFSPLLLLPPLPADLVWRQWKCIQGD